MAKKGDNFSPLIFLLSGLVFESGDFGAGFGVLWQGYSGPFIPMLQVSYQTCGAAASCSLTACTQRVEKR